MKTVMTMRLLNWDMSLTRLLRRGFVTEAVNALINELREMGFKKVVASFFEGNIGSRTVMEKCGMHLNGNSDYEEYRGKKYKCYECEMEL